MPLGTFMGLATGAINNAWAQKREDYARQKNYYFNELSAINADKRTRAMYEDYYSPSAQLRQLREAGLSPSVFFGGQGASGMSATPHGAQGSGVNGISPSTSFIDPLTAAQIENINADTEQKKEETKTEAGTNERGMGEIQGIFADNNLKSAEKANKEADTLYKQLQNWITEESATYQIDAIKNNCQKLFNEAMKVYYDWKQSKLNLKFDEETFKKRQEFLSKQCSKLMSDILLNNEKIRLSGAQRQEIKQKINYMQYQMQMMQWDRNLELNRFRREGRQLNNQWKAWAKEFNLRNRVGTHSITTGYLNAAGNLMGSLFKGASLFNYNNSMQPMGQQPYQPYGSQNWTSTIYY